jgi:hypothetical protein
VKSPDFSTKKFDRIYRIDWIHCFQRERKAKEAKRTPSKRDLSFCLSSGKAKKPVDPVDPV